MTKNKGKPTRQQADERKEREVTDPASPRTIHRLDRSRGDEKVAEGPVPSRQRAMPTPESVRQQRSKAATKRGS